MTEIRSVQGFTLNGWTIRPCHEEGADGFDLLHGEERYHHDHMETAVAAAQASPREEDSLIIKLAEHMDPVEMARVWHEELGRLSDSSAAARRVLIGRLLERIDRYEKNMPSWVHGRPEDYDAWLRDLIPDDGRLRFYQWIGEYAVREAIAEFKENLRNDPAPREFQHYDQESVEEMLEVIDPDHGPVAFPTKLPIGHPFCDVPHHTHTDGGGRLPSCRLDSPE